MAPEKLTPEALRQNRIYVYDEDEAKKVSVPRHIDNLRGMLRQYDFTVSDRYRMDEFVSSIDWDTQFKERDASTEERQAILKNIKRYQDIRAEAFNNDCKEVAEPKWSSFYRESFLNPIAKKSKPSNADDRRCDPKYLSLWTKT